MVFACLCLTVIGSARAQSVTQVTFLPQTYSIGDVVEARVVVRAAADLAVAPPAAAGDYDWIDIRSVAIAPRGDGFEVRIVFQPFFVGTRQMPPVELGDFTLEGVGMYVTPVLAEDRETQLQPIREQLILPGTRLIIGLLALALVGIPTFVIIAGGWTQRWASSIARWYRDNRPYRLAARQLRALHQEMHGMDGRRYYIELLDLVRRYFDRRFRTGLISATTGELDHRLRNSGVSADDRARLVDLFRFGDLVKFANRRVTVAERTEHLEQVRALLRETHRRSRRESSDVGA